MCINVNRSINGQNENPIEYVERKKFVGFSYSCFLGSRENTKIQKK